MSENALGYPLCEDCGAARISCHCGRWGAKPGGWIPLSKSIPRDGQHVLIKMRADGPMNEVRHGSGDCDGRILCADAVFHEDKDGGRHRFKAGMGPTEYDGVAEWQPIYYGTPPQPLGSPPALSDRLSPFDVEKISEAHAGAANSSGSPDKLLEGLILLNARRGHAYRPAMYDANGDIFFGPTLTEVSRLTEDDVVELIKLGWEWNTLQGRFILRT